MRVFVDTDYKCHVTNDGTMREIDAAFFDGKSPAYIEGMRYVPSGESWKRSDGYVFQGEMISPWRDSALLDEFQWQYEMQLASAAAAYAEGVNSI